MKRILLLSLSAVLAGSVSAQGQIGNSDMENWESVASDSEPVNWNSFLTAQGQFTWAAANQIEQSSDVRPGSTGTSSARIWTRNAGFGVKANGNMTLGRINMGSTTASSPDNYNVSLTADSLFSEELTDMPDSIVFWVKYNAANNASEARIKATLHDDYDYRDPEDAAASAHVVATAELNYSPTGGWVRKAVAFDYSGPATGNTHILVTFASNAVPGGGDVDDEVYIDDIELIYNPSSVNELAQNAFSLGMDNAANVINVFSKLNVEGQYAIYNTVGQKVQSGELSASIPFEATTGIYFVHFVTATGSYKFEIYKKDITQGALADENGYYEMSVPAGEAMLICRYSGMIPDTITVNIVAGETLTKDIILMPIVTDIEGVDVKVGKFDKPLEDQTVSMEIIRPELIENKNTRSIETALDQTPGLNILDGEPQIRGGSGFTFGVGSKVAVIVDDMPMLSGDAGRPEWGFIPVENIHQIEVIKGASSVLSGSSALSGAIHIRTAFPGLKPKTKVNVYSGLYSKPSIEGADWWTGTPLISGANFLHSRRIGNLDVVLGANVNYDHGYIGPPKTDSLVEPDTISNFSESQMAMKRARFNFNLRYRAKKFKGLSYGLNGNVMLAQSNLAFAWLNDSSGLYQAYPGAVFLQNQFIFNIDPYLNFFTDTDGKHHFRMRLLHTDNEMTANQSNRSTTIYGDYMFKRSYASLKGFDFIGGLTSTYTNSFANLYAGGGSPNNDILNISAYSQIEKKFQKILNVSVGGRLEYFQLNDTITAMKPVFRAGASLKLYQATFLRASYGQGYRFPTITERFIRTGVGNFGVFPNPNVLPESSWNAEVGIKQGIKFGKIMGYFDVAAFWQEYENTIEYLFGFWGDPVVDPNQLFGFKFVNTGDSRVLGLDVSFSGKAKLGDHVDMTFMTGYNYIVPKTLNPDYVYAIDELDRPYSYNSTSLDSSSQILKYRFLHNVKADMEFTVKNRWSVGFSAKFFSKIVNMDGVIEEFEIATVGPYVQNIRYMDYFADHRFGNWIFDARISYQINELHKIAVIGSNIANRSYSLRPLKIEAPRTIMFQYTFKLDRNS